MTSLTLPRLRARSASLSIPRVRPELAALLVLAGVLNLWALSRNGYANEYYAAAVRSMASSWHNFLFNSFDAAGVMTVDKPPLSTWVQALSVRAFGYSSLSILVPQALMGIGSVALTYDLVRRRFGRFAGFVGGAVLATTPIAVAVARHNNPDALLVLLSVAALWFIVRAFEDGRTRWVVLAGAMVGLGFETKMMAAVLIVPAIAAAYLWVAPRGRVAAVRQLFAGGAVMAVIGLAWPVLMWLTPASSRPWISGTADNSIWSLIWGYNGVGRLQGQAGGPGGMAGGPGGGGGVFGGPTGPLRLLQESIGGQAGWLLGFAVVAGIAILVASRLRRDDARTGWLIATGGAFATIAIAFSAAEGIFHPYYVSLLAPFTAALVGAGAGHAREHGGVLAALMIGGGIFTTLIVLGKDATEITWASGLVVVAGVATAVGAGHRAVEADPDGGDRGRGRGAARRPGELGRADHRVRDQRHVPGRRPGGDDGHGRWRRSGAATPRRSTTPSPTSAPTAAARSAYPARTAARRRRSSPPTATWRASAASPDARARSRSPGSPTPSATAGSAGCSPPPAAWADRPTGAPGRRT